MSLYNHQKIAVEKLKLLSPYKFLIIGDKVGSGKTVIFLAYLQYLKSLNEDVRAVILVNKNIPQQWVDDLEKFFPEITYTLYLNNKKKQINTLVNLVIISCLTIQSPLIDYENIDIYGIDEISSYHQQTFRDNCETIVKNSKKGKLILLTAYNDDLMIEVHFDYLYTLFRKTYPSTLEYSPDLFSKILDDTSKLSGILTSKVNGFIIDKIYYNNDLIIKYINTFTNLLIDKNKTRIEDLSTIDLTSLRYFYEIKFNEKNVVSLNECVENKFCITAGNNILSVCNFLHRNKAVSLSSNFYVIFVFEFIKNHLIDDEEVFNEFIKSILLSQHHTFIFKLFQHQIVVKNEDEDINIKLDKSLIEYKLHKCVLTKVLQVASLYTSGSIQDMIRSYDISGAINKIKIQLKTTYDYDTTHILEGSKESNIVSLIKLVKRLEIKTLESKLAINHTNKLAQEITDKKQNLLDLDNKYKEILSSECDICTLQIEKPMMCMCCQFLLCSNCNINWFKKSNTCPHCRFLKPIVLPIDEKSINSKNIGIKQKHEILEEILSDKTKSIIVFSKFKTTLAQMFSSDDKSVTKLYGSTYDRARIIEAYKTNKIQTLFLNSSGDSAGIRLENTTDIIFIDEFTKYDEYQIIGRAFRLGRKPDKKLYIHKFDHIVEKN